mmetsp:Transcript_87391/g.194294  ORF Transcript_87391/g.194294 Transcript_87391/m.194294 type:complete len:202 (-) Transcript_87391:286-891(-)
MISSACTCFGDTGWPPTSKDMRRPLQIQNAAALFPSLPAASLAVATIASPGIAASGVRAATTRARMATWCSGSILFWMPKSQSFSTTSPGARGAAARAAGRAAPRNFSKRKRCRFKSSAASGSATFSPSAPLTQARSSARALLSSSVASPAVTSTRAAQCDANNGTFNCLLSPRAERSGFNKWEAKVWSMYVWLNLLSTVT